MCSSVCRTCDASIFHFCLESMSRQTCWKIVNLKPISYPPDALTSNLPNSLLLSRSHEPKALKCSIEIPSKGSILREYLSCSRLACHKQQEINAKLRDSNICCCLNLVNVNTHTLTLALALTLEWIILQSPWWSVAWFWIIGLNLCVRIEVNSDTFLLPRLENNHDNAAAANSRVLLSFTTNCLP